MPAPANRSTYSPYPSLGLPPRWRISDLPHGYSIPTVLINTVSVDTTSASFNPSANSIELLNTFSDKNTTCDLIVLNDDGTGNFVQVAEFTGIGMLNGGSLYVGEFDQNITLEGRAIKVTVQNIQGGGTVTVKVNRLN